MHKLNQKGSLLIPLVIVGTLLLGSLVFGFWAYAGRQDYKNNVDGKISEAVEEANTQLAIEKDAEFAEREKEPNRTYQGPAAFGTILITYPKTWSVYLDGNGTGSTPVRGYMSPLIVAKDSIYAFRFEVVENAYEQVLKSYDSYRKNGRVTIDPYRAPQVKGELGSRITGEIFSQQQGEMVILPLRDKTIKLWTEGNDFRKDFNNILEAFTFVP